MSSIERHLVPVDGGMLEVFLAGSGEPAICRSHPFSNTEDPGPTAPWSWTWSPGRTVGVNPRGVGGSSAGRVPQDYSFRQHVDDLEAVRRQFGIERWVFWGGSGGGCIGLMYALDYPQSLHGIIIEMISTGGRRIAQDPASTLSPHYPAYQTELARLAATPQQRYPAISRAQEPMAANMAWTRMSSEAWLLLDSGEPLMVCPTGPSPEAAAWEGWQRAASAFEQFTTVFDVDARLGEIRMPALISAGGLDPFFPVDQVARIQTGIPGAELLVLPNTGHDSADPASADGEQYRATLGRFFETRLA